MSQFSNLSDRNLLFGILAIQVNFIDQDGLVSALQAWLLNKKKVLSEILVEQKQLTSEQVNIMELLVSQHLKAHQDETTKSLQALASIPVGVLTLKDEDLQASIAISCQDCDAKTAPFLRDSTGTTSRYVKLRHHADGGQGRVFVALDSELHREVALKECIPEVARNANSQHRLVMEAEITGGLEHPGIVPVYGLGTYTDGRPYYAMKFIRGDSLHTAIQRFHDGTQPAQRVVERRLEFRQLLRRFVDMCNAVGYAHSRGVVHRDLKPKNVMLGKFGETLVVDWGLAKVGNSPRQSFSDEEEASLRPTSGSSIEKTMDGSQIGTPAFMSPEQANGRIAEIGPATDIYGLGATLYVLLTGKLPFEAPTRFELLEKVRNGSLTPPRIVQPTTPAALDAICCKAMSRRPSLRYESALQLAADIEHWLADEPVTAFAEPWSLRFLRWGRRHRSAVIASVVFLLCSTVALAANLAMVSAEQKRTDQQRQLAVANYRTSREQSYKIIKLIESSEPEFAQVPLLHEHRSDLLQTASDACRTFLEQDPDDLDLKVRAANIFRYAANFHRLTYSFSTAQSLYEESFALHQRLATQPSVSQLLELSSIQRELGVCQVAAGNLKQASVSLAKSREFGELAMQQSPERPDVRRTLALVMLDIANLEFNLNHNSEHLERVREILKVSVDLFQENLQEPKPSARHPYEPLLLALALNQRAILERKSGQLELAQKTHSEADKLLRELRDAKLKNVNENDVTHVLAECQVEQSQTWAVMNQPNFLTNAEKNVLLAVKNLQLLEISFPKLPTYQESLAKAEIVLGKLRLQAQNIAGALEAFQAAKAQLEKLIATHEGIASLNGELAEACMGLGLAAKQSQDEKSVVLFEQAETALRDAMRLSPDAARWRETLEELSAARK